ncbi:hypothetical protein HGRIS_003700 [Hohenbuehelia grisea]|uniref:Uncharacterized protein n=1 Tax=Hohenbuehelia grisea TaxID=104357 RepID=A0ABR3JH51_9AGAR
MNEFLEYTLVPYTLVGFLALMCVSASTATIMYYESASLKYFPPLPPRYMKGCAKAYPSSIIFVCWAIMLAFETFICALTLYKAVDHLRSIKSPWIVNFYRNVLVVSLANIVVALRAPVALSNWVATSATAGTSLHHLYSPPAIHAGTLR